MWTENKNVSIHKTSISNSKWNMVHFGSSKVSNYRKSAC